MTFRTQGTTPLGLSDELMRLVAASIIELGDAQAAASVPGTSAHDGPHRQREVVDMVFNDPRINRAEQVTVTVPRGDTRALEEVRSRLDDEHTRTAGATVLIEGRPSGDTPRPTDRDGRWTTRPIRPRLCGAARGGS
jgi:hypothetical protein